MIPIVLFLILLSSGSAFCAAYQQRKFEEIIPITSIAAVLILFLFGIVGFLKASVYVCIALASALYIFTAVKLVREKSIRSFAQYMITPGFVVFLLASIFFVIGDKGKLANLVDEFSHWADIVKVMTFLDDFGTNPLSGSMFPDYLPGMSIFQYLLQKLLQIATGTVCFQEWYMYFAFQMFIVIILLPFLKDTKFTDILPIIVWCVALYVAPLMVGRFMYRDIYIDPFMGIVSGAGLSMILVWKNKDVYYSVTIWLLCAMLVLSKDIGILFGTVLFLAYSADVILTEKQGINGKISHRKLARIGLCFGFILIPKMLWNWEIESAGVVSRASEGIQNPGLSQILQGSLSDYHREVLHIYWDFINTEGINLGYLPVKISFVIYVLMIIAAFICLAVIYGKKEPGNKWTRAIVLGLSAAQMVLYTFGLSILYMFYFSETEAMNMIAAERYLKMEILSNWLIVIIMATTAMLQWVKKKRYYIVLLVVFVLISPVKELYNVVGRVHVRNSVNYRSNFETMRSMTEAWCNGNDTVYLVCQEKIEDFFVVRFNTYPNNLMYQGILTTDAENAEGKVICSREELQQIWQKDCDYVYLHTPDEAFIKGYGALFENPESITGDTLYIMNSQTGKLQNCQ